MKKYLFGTMPDGKDVYAYNFSCGRCEATVIELGGILQSFKLDGNDIVYGFNKLSHYLEDTCYVGALVGRTCNRIKGGKITIGESSFAIAQNDNGKNHLHGGCEGFNRKLWRAEVKDENTLVLNYCSPDGEEGYPGNLNVTVTYALTENALEIRYEGISDKDTYMSMTNHSYFNLSGLGTSILSQELSINADTYTDVDCDLIPTGNHPSVENTPFDFRRTKQIGRDINSCVTTYDNNFVLSQKKAIFNNNEYNDAALFQGTLGSMNVLTTMPCMQIYTGYFLNGTNKFYDKVTPTSHVSLCLETQFEPDAPSRGESLLRAGEKYEQSTIYIFH